MRRATIGALFVWIGLMMVIDERPGVASIGAGAILLASAAFRRATSGRAGFVGWAVGVLLVVFGLNALNGSSHGIPLLATALIAFGSLVLMRAIGGARKAPRKTIEMKYTPGPFG